MNTVELLQEEERLTLDLVFLPPGSKNKEQKKNALVDLLLKIVEHGELTRKYSALLTLSRGALRGEVHFGEKLLPSPEACANLAKPEEIKKMIRQHFQYRLDLLEAIVKKAADNTYSHARRRKALRIAIKELEQICEEALDELCFKARLLLAEALFERGRIVRPKGFSEPGKKKELFQKAINCIEGNCSEEALRLRARIYLQWYRFFHDEPPCDLDDIFTKALAVTDDKMLKTELLLLCGERKEPDPYTDDLRALLNDQNVSPLSRARAAVLLEDWERCNVEIYEAIEDLGKTDFFQQDWELVVTLLKKNYNQFHGWSRACTRLWEITVEKESKDAGHGCVLRWYWSRQRDVYNLAFAAFEECEDKARVVDSLKNRPAHHFSQLEQLAQSSDIIKQWIESEEIINQDSFAHSLRRHEKGAKSHSGGSLRIFPCLPKGWIAVHFFLASWPEPKGYALIHNADTNTWEQRDFKYEQLWATYIAWQEVSLHNKIRESALLLKSLCETLGKEMRWLFDEFLFPKERRRVLFVPHDFLHRLPLHMAIDIESQTVFAAKQPVCYLPAYHLQNNITENKKTSIYALVNLRENKQQKKDEEIFAEKVEKMGAIVRRPALESDLLNLNPVPEKLVLYCHGIGHSANPFASKLCLGDTGVSYRDILALNRSLAGCRVLLFACETDLVPAQTSSIDEHLSISNALLQKGAFEVLGSLWALPGKTIYGITKTFIDNDDTSAVLHSSLKRLFEHYEKKNEKTRAQLLYNWASLRVLAPAREFS